MKYLSDFLPGQSGYLDKIELGEEDVTQLEGIGLVPGREVRLISKSSQYIISCAGARLALDNSLASGVTLRV